jgi:SP family general alpha glucoside:H+ symporter-like MFS transporter
MVSPITAHGLVTEKTENMVGVNFALGALAATAREHRMGFWQGIRLYPKAIGWSMLISTVVVMEGFDNALIGSFYAFPAFQKKYGELLPDGSYGLAASWQAGLSGAMNAGQVLGLVANGLISERLGYKRTTLLALAATVLLVPLLFFAPNVQTLIVGEVLLGLPLGIFQTLAVAYAAEVCPIVLRGMLTIYVNLSWVIGQLLALCVLRGLVANPTEWSYRIPFAIQWAWPLLLLIGVAFAPESPWWYVRQARQDEALRSLQRLVTSAPPTSVEDFDASETVSMMVHTNELEKTLSAGTNYASCFRGVDRRRTAIACLVGASTNLCGAGLMAYSTYFYLQAGLPTAESFTLSVSQYAIGFVATLLAVPLLMYVGRRTLFMCGLAALASILFAIGFLAIAGQGANISWGIGSLLLVFVFFYNCGVGAPGYVLVAELPSTRLRSKTLVISRILYNILGVVNSVIIPYMLNPTAWGWGAKSGFFWAGLCLAACAACWLFLPETKGRTYAELDVLFDMGVKARHFGRRDADPFTRPLDAAAFRGSECANA